ncbi:MAG: hypothetical protein JWL70_198 [Acidimicrobiia bacterium]|nr:hypothetical protein [Acidimicrobiia bacterium]
MAERAGLIGVTVALAAIVAPGPWALEATAAPSIEVAPASVAPGGTITISGNVPLDGCPAGDAAQLTSTAALFAPDGFGPSLQRDSAGSFHTTYTVTAPTGPGTYTIGVRCGGGNVGISVALNVTATSTKPATTTAPAPTSSDAATTSVATTPTVPLTTTPVSATSKTNYDALWWVLGGALLLIVAGAIVLLARGRGRARP